MVSKKTSPLRLDYFVEKADLHKVIDRAGLSEKDVIVILLKNGYIDVLHLVDEDDNEDLEMLLAYHVEYF